MTDGAGRPKEPEMTVPTVLLPILDRIIVGLENAVTVNTGEALRVPHLVEGRHQGADNVLAAGDAGPLDRRGRVLVVEMMGVVLAVVLGLQLGSALGARGRTGLHKLGRHDGRAERRRRRARVHRRRRRAVADLRLAGGQGTAGRRWRDHGKVAVGEGPFVLVAAGSAARTLLHRVQRNVCRPKVGVVVVVRGHFGDFWMMR